MKKKRIGCALVLLCSIYGKTMTSPHGKHIVRKIFKAAFKAMRRKKKKKNKTNKHTHKKNHKIKNKKTKRY